MKEIVYMDAAASWLKNQSVIESEVNFLANSYANAGRGVCERASNVDKMVANVRQSVADFIGAEPKNVVFTSGTTDGLNRIVNIIKNTESFDKKKPIVAVSDLDHHSARMPWQAVTDSGWCDLVVCPLDSDFNIDVNNIPKCDVFVITAMSNVLGVAQNVEQIIRVARKKNPNVITIVDAAQFVAHKKIDVSKFDCDFLCFSGHKIGADTGVGVMYIRDPDKFNPDKFGGGMVNKITDSGKWILNQSPEKFEAGTLPLTQIIGLGRAIQLLPDSNDSSKLIRYMYDELSKIPRIKILTKPDACILSFMVENMHVLDFGVMIGAHDICIRVGNMCASWIHKKMGLDGSIRISVGPWNTMAQAEYVVETIRKMVK